jgi:hypothetical protein
LSALAVLLTLVACAPTGTATPAATELPTPGTRAARTQAALANATAIPRFPTAAVLVDAITNRPIWPTPLAGCDVSTAGDLRPDLGPTIGEGPLWLASVALPVVPWRNELLRAIMLVDRNAEGELVLSGRGTGDEGAIRFLRPGGERPTEQLHVQSAARIGAATESPTAARYADIPLFLQLPKPGCYTLMARIGQNVQRTFTIEVYN